MNKEITHTWLDGSNNTMERICDAIASGGTLAGFAQDYGLSFATLYQWVNEPIRVERYTAALKARDSFLGDKVLSNLIQAASVDMRDAYDKSGNLLPLTAMPEHFTGSITAVTVVRGKGVQTTTKLQITPRHVATESLGKQLGMYKDRVELTGRNGGPVEMSGDVTNDVARRVAFLLQSAIRDQETDGMAIK